MEQLYHWVLVIPFDNNTAIGQISLLRNGVFKDYTVVLYQMKKESIRLCMLLPIVTLIFIILLVSSKRELPY